MRRVKNYGILINFLKKYCALTIMVDIIVILCYNVYIIFERRCFFEFWIFWKRTYLLNSLTITIRFLKWHNLEEKKLLEEYFDFEDYCNEYFLIELLYKRLSLAGNKYFYNVKIVDKFKKVV